MERINLDISGNGGFGVNGPSINAPVKDLLITPSTQTTIAGTLGLGMQDAGSGSIMNPTGTSMLDDDETYPDTDGFTYNDENIYSSFLGNVDFDNLKTKASNGLKLIIQAGTPLAKQLLLYKLQKANPKNAASVTQILNLFALHGKAKALAAKGIGVTDTAGGLSGDLKGIIAPQLSEAEQSQADAEFDNFIGLHVGVLNNRLEYSNYDGNPDDIDFMGFTPEQKQQYSDFLGIDFGKIAKAVGNAVGSAGKAVGKAVGSAGKAVGNAVAKVATGTAHVVRDVGVGVAHGVARAGVAVGQTTARGVQFVARNAGSTLEVAGGVAALFAGQSEGASLIASGLESIITDANGGVDPFSNTQDATNQAAAIQAAGATGGMMGGDGFNPDPDPFGISGGDSTDDGNVSPEDIYAQQQAAMAPPPPAPIPFYKKPIFMIGAAVAVAIVGYFIYKHYHKHGLKVKK